MLDKSDLRNALREVRSEKWDRMMPFVYYDLTDGIIQHIVDNMNKIATEQDISVVVPGIDLDCRREVMNILDDMFELS